MDSLFYAMEDGMHHISRWAGLVLSLGLIFGAMEPALAQSHYSTKQAQESYDAGIKYEQQAEQKGDKKYLERALSSYREAVEAEPNMANAYVRLGYVYYALGRSKEGVDILRTALQKHPDNVELKHYLGLNLFQEGQLDEAQKILNEVTEVRQDLPEAFFVLGKIQLDRGQFEAAQMNFAKYADLTPNDVQAYRALSQAYIQAKNVDGAELSLSKLLEMAPDDVLATINMGHVKFEHGQVDEAVRYYEKALDMDSRHNELYYTIASAYYLSGQYEEAIKRFNRVLEDDPTHMSAQYFIADSELKLGRLDDAEKHFRELGEKMPNYRYIQLKLDYIQLQRGDKKALDDVERQIEKSDHPEDIHFGAVMLRRAGKSDASLNLHKRLADNQPDKSIYSIYLARDYLETHNYGQAAEVLQSVIDTDMNNHLAWEMLSLSLLYQGSDAMMLGDFEQAKQFFEQSLGMDVHAIQAQCSLSQLALLEGDLELAYSIYQAAEQISADDPNVVKLAAQFDIMDGAYDYAVKRLTDLNATQSARAMGGTGWYLMAVAQSNLGAWSEAEKALAEAEKFGVVDSPASAMVALENAMKAIKVEDYDSLAKNLERVDQYKDGLDALDKVRFDYLTAISHIRNKRFSQAKSALESARNGFDELNSESRNLIVNKGVLDLSFELAYVYYETGNLDSAISLIEKHQAKTRDKDKDFSAIEAAVRRKLGFQALRAKKFDKAIDNYNRIDALGAKTTSDQFNLVVARLMANRLTDANSTLSKLANQETPEGVLNYAIYLDKSGDAALATRYYEKYVGMSHARKAEDVRKMLATKQRVWGSQATSN